MSVSSTLASAGKTALRATTGIDLDLANRREKLRAILADRPARVEAMKAQAIVVKETARKIESGEIHAGRLRFEEAEFQRLAAAVEACKAAETQLKESAPQDAIFCFRTVGRDHYRCQADLQRLEKESQDAANAAAAKESELNELRAIVPTKYENDPLSTFQSAESHRRQVEYATRAVNLAQHEARELQLKLAATRKELPLIAERLAEARRRLIES